MPAHFDADGPALIAEHLTLHDSNVLAEARHWPTGRRGAAVPATEMADCDLTAFVTQAAVVGSQAIATAGGTQEAYRLDALVADVGERTSQLSREAERATGAAVQQATATIEASTAAARKTFDEIAAQSRRSFTESVETAGTALRADLTRLLGGENSELLNRLGPVIEKFGRELEARTAAQTVELITKAARALDPADPASPAAQQARALAEQQERLAATLTAGSQALTDKIDTLVEATKVAQAASSARAAVVSTSSLKGDEFEDALQGLLAELATGFGDEYRVTARKAGRFPNNRKGDGVLAVNGGDVRVAVEMSDSQRNGWSDYLRDTERNRDAVASLGIVRSPEQLGGHSVLSLGPRRIVVAFDPDTGSADLLRTVLQLLRLAALAAASRQQDGDVRVADEKIASALAVLVRIDEITKSVGLIQRHAKTIGGESDELRTEISRLLTQARAALGAHTSGTDNAGA
ncbi:Fis family transcriptional regulator [Pseudonocardia nantongensis]|uniref:Fis family transcriptional regulator n=1 Tax=Pseudonocardia nantongensis TaxID=1181885 RepID=UPI003978E802